MSKQSGGLLLYRQPDAEFEVLLIHPAGPIWGHKDFWSIPKGELDEGEDHLAAAFREFEEEVGWRPEKTELLELGSIKQSNGKTNYIWAMAGDFDPANFKCHSLFEIEWPPHSGKIQSFPENDKAEWFSLAEAKRKLFKGQMPFIDRLAEKLSIDLDQAPDSQDTQQALL